MAKNKAPKRQEEFEDDFDCSDMADMDSCGEHGLVEDLVEKMLETSQNQTVLAIELAKLAIEKSTPKNRTEADVFSTFKKAFSTIEENFSLQTVLAKLDGDN